jgi:hypothetical protein
MKYNLKKYPNVSVKKLRILLNDLKNTEYKPGNTLSFKHKLNKLEKLINRRMRRTKPNYHGIHTPEHHTEMLKFILTKQKVKIPKRCVIYVARKGRKYFKINTRIGLIKKYFKGKRGKMLVPVSIHNLQNGKGHLELMVVQFRDRTVYRIEPSKGVKKNTPKFNKVFKDYFKKLNLNYKGFYKNSKTIEHGGLCRYASPALYIYGKSLNHKKIKILVIRYLSTQIQRLV